MKRRAFLQSFKRAFIPAALLAMTLGGVATAFVPLAGSGSRPAPASSPGPGEPTLEEVRAATERFRDVKVALAEGYIRDPGDLCDTAEMMGRPASQGAMGIHFFRPDLLGITGPPSPRVDGTGTHTDFRQPSILIYEPQKDGSLALVAVENLVFARAWRERGHTAPPTFHGVPYDSMVDDPATATDEAHMFEPHFDRHVWIYRDNPQGVFAQFNPMVTCAHHQGPKDHSHPTQQPTQPPAQAARSAHSSQ